MHKPLVSVIIPFRNDVGTIESTVHSVLAQSYRPIDLVLCDDGSTDGSLAIATAATQADTSVTTRIVSVGGSGAAVARNAGIRVSEGEFIAFLDADDSWFSEKLSRCVEQMCAESLDVVSHAEEWRTQDGAGKTVSYAALVNQQIPLALSVFRINPFSTSATVVRRSSLISAGLFDESLDSAEDYDLWIRLCLLPGIRVAFLSETLGVYLLRESSESSRVDARHSAMLAIGERYLSRIKAIAGASVFERVRYRSRVRLSSGIRYFRTGQRTRGILLAALGLIQWPFRKEIALWIRARTSGGEVPVQQVSTK